MADWYKDEKLRQRVYEEAKAGDTAMQCELARVLMENHRIEEGIGWYKQAAALGMTDAAYNLGLIYSQGTEGIAPNPFQAFFWYEQAARAGDAEAMYLIGSALLSGQGCEKNEEEARLWLSKAAGAGYGPAAAVLMQTEGMEGKRGQVLSDVNALVTRAEGLLSAGEPARSLPVFEEALKIAEAGLGKRDAVTVSILNNLAVAYSRCGQFDKSIPLKEKVLSLREQSLSINHPDYISSLTNLSGDYAACGRLQSALSLSQKAYAIVRENYPLEHALIYQCLNRLCEDLILLCRQPKALEQLSAVETLLMHTGLAAKLDPPAASGLEKSKKLKSLCEADIKEHAAYFGLSTERRSYAYICCELMEMLDSLPEGYRSRIAKEELEHFGEQAALVTCYRRHLTASNGAETDPYTNTLQTLLSFKYLMQPLAECEESAGSNRVRALVTWINNELCLILTIYPELSFIPDMDKPQPVDFVKSLNAHDEESGPVLSLNAVDLKVSLLKDGRLSVLFAYGSEDVFRMIRVHYNPQDGSLKGDQAFTTMREG